jgi:predicted branched-subunit amino acid permease
LGAGLSFYIAWVLFSVLGIYLASTVPNLSDFHLDFSIVAVFVAIIVPLIKNQAAFVGVVVTLLAALVFKYFHIDAAIVLSGVIGMLTSMCLEAKGGQ